jgi:hypothetical protein
MTPGEGAGQGRYRQVASMAEQPLRSDRHRRPSERVIGLSIGPSIGPGHRGRHRSRLGGPRCRSRSSGQGRARRADVAHRRRRHPPTRHRGRSSRYRLLDAGQIDSIRVGRSHPIPVRRAERVRQPAAGAPIDRQTVYLQGSPAASAPGVELCVACFAGRPRRGVWRERRPRRRPGWRLGCHPHAAGARPHATGDSSSSSSTSSRSCSSSPPCPASRRPSGLTGRSVRSRTRAGSRSIDSSGSM